MPHFRIVSRWNPDQVLYEGEAVTLADLVGTAVKMGASLDGASLDGASLRNASLDDASLWNASLRNASLDGASLRNASLRNASLDGASLDGASLDGASLDGASLDGASLRNASLDGASLWNASLDGASLRNASLRNASLRNASLDGASLDGASLDGASLDGASLWNASLRNASLRNASLDGASLDGASLDGRNGAILTLIGARPYFEIGPIGSRSSRVVLWLTDQGPRVVAGCWRGSLDEFRARIASVYPEGRHGDEYRAAIALMEVHARLWTPAGSGKPCGAGRDAKGRFAKRWRSAMPDTERTCGTCARYRPGHTILAGTGMCEPRASIVCATWSRNCWTQTDGDCTPNGCETDKEDATVLDPKPDGVTLNDPTERVLVAFERMADTERARCVKAHAEYGDLPEPDDDPRDNLEEADEELHDLKFYLEREKQRRAVREQKHAAQVAALQAEVERLRGGLRDLLNEWEAWNPRLTGTAKERARAMLEEAPDA